MKRLKSLITNPIDVVKSNVKRLKNDTSQDWKLDICAPCENKVPDPVFGDFMCDLCLCPLKSLIHSDKGCERQLWQK